MIQIILKCTFFVQNVSKACQIAKQTNIDFWNWKYSDCKWAIQEFICIYRGLNQTKKKMIIFHLQSAHIWKFHEKFETWWLEVIPCFFLKLKNSYQTTCNFHWKVFTKWYILILRCSFLKFGKNILKEKGQAMLTKKFWRLRASGTLIFLTMSIFILNSMITFHPDMY